MKHKAILNGVKTTAEKIDGEWIVGGDYTSKTDHVLIACKCRHDGELAWHKLQGCRLIFDDYVGYHQQHLER